LNKLTTENTNIKISEAAKFSVGLKKHTSKNNVATKKTSFKPL